MSFLLVGKLICGFSELSQIVKDDQRNLLEAAQYGDLNEVVEKVNVNVDVNCTNEYGSSPLLLATMNGHFEVARVIIRHGGNVNYQGPLGWTPLHVACFYGHIELVSLLLENGAYIQIPNDSNSLAGEEFDCSVLPGLRQEISELIEKKTKELDTNSSLSTTGSKPPQFLTKCKKKPSLVKETSEGQGSSWSQSSRFSFVGLLKQRFLPKEKLEMKTSKRELQEYEDSTRGCEWSLAAHVGKMACLKLSSGDGTNEIQDYYNLTDKRRKEAKALTSEIEWRRRSKAFKKLMESDFIEWTRQGKDVKRVLRLSNRQGLTGQISLDDFESAVQTLGNATWVPLSVVAYDVFLEHFGVQGTGDFSFVLLFQFIDRIKHESPRLGAEPHPDQFAKRALFFLLLDHPFRSFFIDVAFHPVFQQCMIVVILVNALVMGLIDYSVVDSSGQPTSAGSFRNTVVAASEPLFTAIFTLELLVKVGALGFAFEPYTYMRNGWNVFDFIIVLSSLMTLAPNAKKFRILKVFRVLRPLKTLNKLKGLKRIINGLIGALGDLRDVLLIFLIIMYLFTTIGVDLFSGSFHARCRVTPFPVLLPENCTSYYDPCWPEYLQEVILNPDAWRCLSAPNDSPEWTKADSPWSIPQDCIWPLNPDEFPLRLCSLSGGGNNKCILGQTCGSDYDMLGNPRFIDSPIPFGIPRMSFSLYFPDFLYGTTLFDNFGESFLSLFQVLTLTDWSLMESMGMDAVGQSASATFFIFFCFFGSYVILNLVLGVMTDALTNVANKEKMEALKQSQEEGEGEEELEPEKVENDTKLDDLLRVSFELSHREETKSEWEPSRSNVCGSDLGDCLPTDLCSERFEKSFERALSIIEKGKNEPPVKQTLKPTWKRILTLIVDSKIFSNIMLGCICFNTVVLALDHYPESDSLATTLSTINVVLTIMFAVEMVLVLNAYGYKSYIRSPISLFDGFIVITSLCELLVGYVSQNQGSGISALRTFRIFRLFKLVSHSKNLQVLLRKMLNTFLQMGNFGLLLSMFIYIFALLGMELFANKLHFDPTTGAPISLGEPGYSTAFIPRQNFDTTLWALTTVFGILTFDNWDYCYQMCRVAAGFPAVIYFVLLITVGCFITMNLFMAILLMNFAENEVEKENENENVKDDITSKPDHSLLSSIRQRTGILCGPAWRRMKGMCAGSRSKFATSRLQSLANKIRSCCKWVNSLKCFSGAVLFAVISSSMMLCFDSPLNDPNGTLSRGISSSNTLFAYFFIVEAVIKIIAMNAFTGPDAYFRDYWNIIDFGVTFAGMISLYQTGAGTSTNAIRMVRVIRPARLINRVEGLKKVVSVILKSIPTMLDIAAVCVLFLLIFSIFSVTFLKGALYACSGQISSLSNDQMNFLNFPLSWNDMTEVQRQWFVNSSCSDAGHFPVSPTSEDICNCWFENSWSEVNPYPMGFNNVISGFFTLYECATLSNWQSIMWSAVDQRGIGFQPIKNSNELWVVFFVVFIFMVGIFLINVFVGGLVDFFNQIKSSETDDRVTFSTPAQREWIGIQYLISQMKKYRKFPMPRSRFRLFLYKLVIPPSGRNKEEKNTAILESMSVTIICLNAIVMAMQFFSQPDLYAQSLQDLNLACTLFFNFEAGIKLVAFGRYFFKDSWNIFDFVVVVSADASLLATVVFGRSSGALASLGRVLRLFRLVNLSSALSGVKRLLKALITSIPGFFNVAALLVMVYFIYAVLGVQLFATIASNASITPMANFRSLAMAMIVLFKISSGDNWNNFIHGVTEHAPGCVATVTYSPDWCELHNFKPDCVPLNGCGSFAALPYFYSFYLLLNIILLNLFVGVIMDSISVGEEVAVTLKHITEEVMEQYNEVWDDIDPYKTNFLPAYLLPQFFKMLGEPLGLKAEDRKVPEVVNLFIQKLNLTLKKNGGVDCASYDCIITALAKEFLQTRQIFNKQELDGLQIEAKPNPVHHLKAFVTRELEEMAQEVNRVDLAALVEIANDVPRVDIKALVKRSSIQIEEVAVKKNANQTAESVTQVQSTSNDSETALL